MNFPVPWRALLPADAVPTVAGADGRVLQELCHATGAGLELSGEGETPATLSDRVCTISGSVEQKEAACRRIVDKLRGLQEVADQEPGVFVIIVPSCAAPAVVGQKGAQIKEVIELSGAEISVGKENIIGMLDQPIGITGTGGQVVSAVSKINAILQDLADRGRLQPSDFRYRPGAQGSGGLRMAGDSGGGFRGPAPSGGNPRTHAKFVVATQVAGWIIGKQGRHIRELQENSGAHIQVHKEGDVPPGVSTTDRIVEIGGRFEAKAEGIQIVLMAIDSMPALQGPRETQLLVPRILSTSAEIKEVKQMSGSEVEVRDLPGHEETLCTLLGTIEARVKAAQQFLTRLEQLGVDGTAGLAAAGAEGHRQPAAAPLPAAREDPPRQQQQAAPMHQPGRQAEAPPLRRSEDASGSDPWSQGDPWAQGKPAAAPLQQPPCETAAPLQEQPAAVGLPSKFVSFSGAEVVFGGSASASPASQAAEQPQPWAPPLQQHIEPELQQSAETVATSKSPPGDPSGGMGFVASGSAIRRDGFVEKQWGPLSTDGPTPQQQEHQEHRNTTTFPPSGAFQQHSSADQMSFSPCEPAHQQSSCIAQPLGGNLGAFNPCAPMQEQASSAGGCLTQQLCGGGMTSFTPCEVAQQAHVSSATSSVRHDSASLAACSSVASFTPAALPGMCGLGAMGGIAGMGAGLGAMSCFGSLAGMGLMGPMSGGLDLFGGMGIGMGATGSNEAIFQAALQSNSMAGGHAQLHLLLSMDVLQAVFLPHGHLGAIAQRCQVRIDLGAEVPPNMRQVSLTGAVAANAMATYFLQERAQQYAGSCLGALGGMG